jgi:hypothetical protein
VPASAPAVAPPPASLQPSAPAASAPELLPSTSAAIDQPRTHRRWGVFAGGVTLFLLGYGANIAITYGTDHQPATTSLIPVVGPLLQMTQSYSLTSTSVKTNNAQLDQQANAMIADVNRTVQTVAYVGLAVDCAMQLAGLVMAIAGSASNYRDAPSRANPRLQALAGRPALALSF